MNRTVRAFVAVLVCGVVAAGTSAVAGAASGGQNFRWAPDVTTADHWSCGGGGVGGGCSVVGTAVIPHFGPVAYDWEWSETNGIPGHPDPVLGWVYDLSQSFGLTITTPRGSVTLTGFNSCTTADTTNWCDATVTSWAVTGATGMYDGWTGSGTFAAPLYFSFPSLVGRITPHA